MSPELNASQPSAARPTPRRRELGLEDYLQGVLSGDRALLARAITLVESTLPAHQALAQELLNRLLPHTGGALRVGVTGVPGVGKSTFIEALGTRLLERGRRVAVLAVDPSSLRSGGSILGDKTRMERLSADPRAFIRPSPSAGTLGGVARMTREAGLLCEAAGYDVVLIETVGVGQSETLVAGMVDFFLVLMLAGAGDELQGIKRGLLELADAIAITKADGPDRARANHAATEYSRALRYLEPPCPGWTPPVLTLSAQEGEGLGELWDRIEEHRRVLAANGERERRRQEQRVRWMWDLVEDRLRAALHGAPGLRPVLAGAEAEVRAGTLTPTTAAERILNAYHRTHAPANTPPGGRSSA